MEINPVTPLTAALRQDWEVPSYQVPLWQGRSHDYCVLIPVINEGQRIANLLKRMQQQRVAAQADIIVVDAGSSDDSLDINMLAALAVRGLVVKTGPGKLSAQLRCGYAFALDKGYDGIVTIDGNDKDDPEAIPAFIAALKRGVDFVQASRYIAGGVEDNTPWIRTAAIRLLHAPLLSLAARKRWTDTTQGFRAYSRRLLLDPAVAPFRNVFMRYELLAYMSCRAPRLGYTCIELPTIRRYPAGEVPTKISGWRGNAALLWTLIQACMGAYNPRI